MARSRGFTLIELLVVIAIIGVLSSVVLASLSTARLRANDARRLSDMHALVTALEMYANDHGGLYPPDPPKEQPNTGPCDGDGVSLGDSATGDDCVDEFTVLTPYIKTLPADPEYANTDNNYQYCTADNGVTYGLIMRSDLLVPNNWCRPQVPFILSPKCPYNAFPMCQ
ncbi:MAG: prepilin-type N-terminal cleavage/methylation domain-containing protein [Minisyncoccota bacterium]